MNTYLNPKCCYQNPKNVVTRILKCLYMNPKLLLPEPKTIVTRTKNSDYQLNK